MQRRSRTLGERLRTVCERETAHTIQHVHQKGLRSAPYLGMLSGPCGRRGGRGRARVRVRKECGDVTRTQGNVCEPFVHTKPRIKHVHPTADDQTYLSECFGPASGPFDNIINCRARVRVRKECGDAPRTQVHRLCTQSLHTMQRVQPNGRRSIPFLGMIWAIVGGRSTTSSAALRAFVCAKSAETFPAHRGTSVHRLCTQSLHTMQRVQPNGRR